MKMLINLFALMALMGPLVSDAFMGRPLGLRVGGWVALAPLGAGADPVADPVVQNYSLDGKPIRGPLTPLSNYVFVRQKDAVRITQGGMFLPDQSVDKPTEGVVLAMGEGRLHPHTGIRISGGISVGETVVYGKFDGTTLEYNGEEVRCVRDDDVIMVYQGDYLELGNSRCCKDYVLVDVDAPGGEEKTQSGIAVAKAGREDLEPCTGKVIMVGEGRTGSDGKLTKSLVKVGEEVKFRDYAGNDIAIGGESYVAVRMTDILSKL